MAEKESTANSPDAFFIRALDALKRLCEGAPIDDADNLERFGEYNSLISQLNGVCLMADFHEEARAVRQE